MKNEQPKMNNSCETKDSSTSPVKRNDGGIQIEIDKGSGFCFGVTTAIKKQRRNWLKERSCIV